MTTSTFSPLTSLFTLAPKLRSAGRAVSLYAPVSAEGFNRHAYDLELGHLVRRYRGRLSEDDRHVLDRELLRLSDRIDVVRPAGCPAIAGFADEANGVLELISLRLPTEARLEVGDLLLAPILRQLEEFPPSIVAVVDKERAMTFGAILNEVRALETNEGLDVRHTRAGGTSALSNQRRADNRTHMNLEGAIKTLEREMGSGAYSAIYLAGPAEARAEFAGMLPGALRAAVAGHLGVSLDSPHLEHDVREHLRRPGAKGVSSA
jgi:hypothetical protein